MKESIIKAFYKIQNSFVRFLVNIMFCNNNILGSKKILIFRTGSFGDSLCALPAINDIRKNFKNSQIDLLTNAGGNNLVSIKYLIKGGIVDEIIDYIDIDKKELFNILKSKKYDLFIDLSQDPTGMKTIVRNIGIVKFLGIKNAFGWSINSIKVLKKVQNECINFDQETFRLKNTLLDYGLKSFDIEYPLNIEQEDIELVEQKLGDYDLLDKNKNIVFILGAKRETNRWPVEYFNEVSEYLLKKGYNILCLGGKDDDILVKQLTPNDKLYNFTGELTPLQSAIVLKNSKLTISNDTGPMHLSYVVNTPVIAMFSSRDFKGKWFPLDNEKINNKVFRNNDIDCVNCFVEVCDKNNECIRSIKPDQIIKELSYFNI